MKTFRRFSILRILLIAFALTLISLRGCELSLAQATPTLSGDSGQVLAETTVASLPPAPSIVALSRLTLVSDVSISDISVPGPELIAVESGILTVSVPGDDDEADEIEGRVRRGGTPIAEGLATPTEGIFLFTLVPGDSLFVPGDTPHTVHSFGGEPAIFLVAAVTPQPADNVDSTWPPGTSETLPEGASIERLDVGYDVATSTLAPARIVLQRMVTSSNEIIPRQQAGGPELFVVERGALEVDVVSGTVDRRDALAAQSESIQADESAATPTTVQTIEGGAVLIQPGTIAVVRSASGPITMLVLTVLPA
jgi:hypothetical protein